MKTINRPTTLVLIRHAESQRNQVKKGNVYFPDDDSREGLRGIPDHKIPLTKEGHKQASQAGPEIKKIVGVPDYIYHSGYLKTIQTMNGLLEAYKKSDHGRIRIRMNHFVRERDPGHAYDMTDAEVKKYFPYLDEYWKTFGGFFARPPGGESLADVCYRVYLFLNMLFREHGGKKIVVVTHCGTMRCFRFLMERWSYDQVLTWSGGNSPQNCGMIVYQYDKEAMRLVLQNYEDSAVK